MQQNKAVCTEAAKDYADLQDRLSTHILFGTHNSQNYIRLPVEQPAYFINLLNIDNLIQYEVQLTSFRSGTVLLSVHSWLLTNESATKQTMR